MKNLAALKARTKRTRKFALSALPNIFPLTHPGPLAQAVTVRAEGPVTATQVLKFETED